MSPTSPDFAAAYGKKPSSVAAAQRHSVPEPRDGLAHGIRVQEASRLRAALGSSVDATAGCGVNSRHHQAVGRVGKGLVASAVAEDGVVEAIEAPGVLFCLGVQWHPENFWRSGEFNPLFDAFVAAARSRRADRPHEEDPA